MVKLRGGGATNLEAADEQRLRGNIESATAAGTNTTGDHMVDIIRSALPHTYSQPLTERVAGITLLPLLPCSRSADAVDEPTPVLNKRRKKDVAASRKNEVSRSPVPASAPEEDGSSEPHGLEPDRCESGRGRGEMNEDSDGDRRDLNRVNRETLGILRGGDGSGNGRNGDGGSRDGTENNRPMFRDLGGLDSEISELQKEVIVPLHQLKLLHHLGVDPPAGVLLIGPPGCGKTTLARALGNEAGVSFYEISAARLMSGVLGATEEKVRELFSTAYMSGPSILFIDEIDAMTSMTESLQKETNPCIVEKLMACMDGKCRLNKPLNHDAGYVLVIGATNRPDALDPALRQRFDREIVIDAPSDYARGLILTIVTLNLKVEACFDHAKIGRCTLGFVGRDLVALAKKAGTIAVNRIMKARQVKPNQEYGSAFQVKDHCRQPFSTDELENLSITMADFVKAGKSIQPSSRIDRISTISNAKWDDVGGLQLLKLEFERHIVKRIKFPEVHKDLGVQLATSFFLYGANGCGKTLIVEALANEAGAKLTHVKCRKFVQDCDKEGELVLRILFKHARACSPCILFLDEVEAIAFCRCKLSNPTTSHQAEETVFCRCKSLKPIFDQLLMELNDLKEMDGVYVIAATNRPDLVSSSFFTAGNYKKLLYTPLPSPEERGEILRALARNKPIDSNVDLMALGKDVACNDFSGDDLRYLMKQAAKAAIDRPTLLSGGFREPWTIKDADFRSALKKISPSVSVVKLQHCELFAGLC